MTERLVFRAPRLLVVSGAGLAVTSLVNAWLLTPWLLAAAALGVAQVVLHVRLRTVADDDGMEVRTVLRTRRVPWSRVAAVAPRRRAVVAVLDDGEEVTLPYVEWHPPLPERYARRRSAQALVQRARAAGHDVAVRG